MTIAQLRQRFPDEAACRRSVGLVIWVLQQGFVLTAAQSKPLQCLVKGPRLSAHTHNNGLIPTRNR